MVRGASGAHHGVMGSEALPRPVVAAGIGLVLVTPVVTWWAVGDLSEDVTDPDYLFHPLPLGPGAELAIGLAATVVALGAVVVLAVAARRRQVDRRWLAVLGPLLAAGALCGFGWRILTAGVGGANIGGGMVLLFGPWIVLGLVAGAAWQWHSIRRRG
jgi:uncharacterized membrane protein YfcA